MMIYAQFVLLSNLIWLSSAQDTIFSVTATRTRDDRNILTMQCISAPPVTGESLFFLSGSNLEERSDLIVERSRNRDYITFLLRQDLEGNYTCTKYVNSGKFKMIPVPFVVYPSFRIVPRIPPMVFAEYGSTAVLDCSLSPGRLLEQYFVTWRNGSSRNIYADIPRPFFATNQVVNTPSSSRYIVRPSTFALEISDVVLSDTNTMYRCEVGVEDPQDKNTAFSFEATTTINIRLMVYKRPHIIIPPRSAVVSLRETRQVRYECTAVGDPAPQITWTHNGQETTSLTMYHTISTIPEKDEEERGFIVTGSLEIFPLMEDSTGNVTCEATISSNDVITGGVEVPKDVREARLSVLGGFKNIDVLVTQDGDVIFRLNLLALINTPVHLFLIYEDAELEKNGVQLETALAVNRTTTISYNNTVTITHIEFKSQVPFQVFRVGVALFSNSVIGPIQMSPQLHNVNLPTLACTSSLPAFRLSIAATISVLTILVVFATITIITYQVIRIRKRKTTLDFQEAVVNRHTDVLQILIERLPDDLSPTTFTKLFELIERILINSAEDCCETQFSSDVAGNRDSHHGYCERETIVEMDETELPVVSLKSAVLLKTLGNVIQTGMQNPKLRPHLDRHMSFLIGQNNPKLNRHFSEPLDIGHSTALSISACSAKYI